MCDPVTAANPEGAADQPVPHADSTLAAEAPAHVVPRHGPIWIVSFVILLIVLLFRPQGLFGEKIIERV